MASKYTHVNFDSDVENVAPGAGMTGFDARFGREALELENSGVSRIRIDPRTRIPFGHTHETQEEVYIVLRGSARLKLDDEILELKQWDAVRIAPGVMRNLEG